MNKLFEILESDIHKDDIEVFLKKGTSEKSLLIPRAKFEKWLEDSGRLEKCIDGVDAFGEHEQDIFNVPVDQYYLDFSNEKIEYDLYDYIILNYTDPFDIKPALSRILENAFSHV